VIVYHPDGRLLLQLRHCGKYHSGGLWTNTCCSHPRPAEPVEVAAARRLHEEMGIACPLSPLMTVAYRADVGNNMIEHELVRVFAGRFEGPVRPDPTEADGFAWIAPEDLRRDIAQSPERYSVWFQKYCTTYWRQLMEMTGRPETCNDPAVRRHGGAGLA
jgi:isopentenyl-diphosphate delta-isomerase